MDLRFFKGEPITVKRKTYTGEKNPNTGESIAVETELTLEGLLYFRKSDGSVTPYEVGYDTKMSVIFPNGTVVLNTDIFSIRGELWESDGIGQPISQQHQYDRFLKPPVVMTLRQHKGNVNG